MAASYLESYLATSVPVVTAGYSAQTTGLLPTTNLFDATFILLAATAPLQTAARCRTARLAHPAPPLPPGAIGMHPRV